MCTMRTHRLTAAARWRRSTRRRSSSRGRAGRHGRGRCLRASSARTCASAPARRIGPHCVIEGHTTIGRDNRIFQFCSIGARAAGQEVRRRADRAARSATATRSASSAPSTSARCRTTASPASATTTGSWPTCTSRTTASVGNQTILANNADARRPRAPRRLGDRRRARAGVHQFVKVGAHAMIGFAEPRLAGRAAVHDGRRQSARGARLQRRGPAPARLLAPSASPPSSRCTGCCTARA